MKTEPIVPARLEWTAHGVPGSPAYGDVYHPVAGALIQADHVFLAGNGLPQRWQRRERFVILETGFGLGNNFLATWNAWRADASRCARLHFISIEKHPLVRDDLRRAQRDSPLPDLAAELVAAWPPLTPNLHRLAFEGGRIELLIALGDVSRWLPELVARVDAFYLDGFAPARNPAMWQPRIFKALARLAAPDATAATWTAARSVRDGLAATGFEVRRAPGIGGKRDITLARYAPAFVPRRPIARSLVAPGGARRAMIVGAGISGCAAALALSEHGWHGTVLERHPAPAGEASGNPGGLFHGIVNRQDGTHARFNRCAALHAAEAVRRALKTHRIDGAVDGLLRLDTSGADAQALRESVARLALPADYVQAVDATAASALAGIALSRPAWWYPGGGWVDPAGLSNAWLDAARPAFTFIGDRSVASLQRRGAVWRSFDSEGDMLDEADVVVLANAGDALRLLGSPAWPVRKVRGQISIVASESLGASLPRVPIAGSGYLLPDLHGLAVFGATAQPDDDDASSRLEDHLRNVEMLGKLLASPIAPPIAPPTGAWRGRTAWRWVCADRLPVVGAVADAAASKDHRLEQVRWVPREAGLFVMTAMGSRGIGWSMLSARVLASAISGAPAPLEASLLDAIDPARFMTRETRRRP